MTQDQKEIVRWAAAWARDNNWTWKALVTHWPFKRSHWVHLMSDSDHRLIKRAAAIVRSEK